MTHALLAKPSVRQHQRVAHFAMIGVAATPLLDHLRQQAFEDEIASWNQQRAVTITTPAIKRKSRYGRVSGRP